MQVLANRGVLFVVLIYSPSLDAIFVFKLLVDYNVAGSMVTSLIMNVVDIQTTTILELVIYLLVILLSIASAKGSDNMFSISTSTALICF